jgi:MYXO-CTERM domain-containing protein
MSTHFGSTTGVWSTGDFNYDGKVNALDFNAIATNFGSPAITAPALEAAVPEPGVFALLGAVTLLARQRRGK